MPKNRTQVRSFDPADRPDPIGHGARPIFTPHQDRLPGNGKLLQHVFKHRRLPAMHPNGVAFRDDLYGAYLLEKPVGVTIGQRYIPMNFRGKTPIKIDVG